MPISIEAVFDGKVFLPVTLPPLKPGTRVRLSIISSEIKTESFLDTARSLQIDGPPDWSEKINGSMCSEV